MASLRPRACRSGCAAARPASGRDRDRTRLPRRPASASRRRFAVVPAGRATAGRARRSSRRRATGGGRRWDRRRAAHVIARQRRRCRRAQPFLHRPEQILFAPRRDHQQPGRIEPGGQRRRIGRRVGGSEGLAAPQQGAGAQPAHQEGGEGQRRAVVRRDPAGRRRARLDFVQGAGQQAAVGQQPVDLRQAERYGHPARALDAMGALQPTNLLSQGGRNGAPEVIGDRGRKSMWGNDGHRPLDPVSGLGITNVLLFVLFGEMRRVNGAGDVKVALPIISFTHVRLALPHHC